MKKNVHTVAFVYNVRHVYPDPKDSRSQKEADYDDPKTIQSMEKHLRACGYKVIPIEATVRAFSLLKKYRAKVDLVFNYAEGYGRDREAQIPILCELLQIPYTGSSPLTHALLLDKAKTKEILVANNVSTLPFQLMKTGAEKRDKRLAFPLIVKPNAEGSSAGITDKSVVRALSQLKKQVAFVWSTFHQPALVEPFLAGREFSVGMIGNPPRMLPMIEPQHDRLPKGYQPIDSLEVKWVYEEQGETNYLRCPAQVSSRLRKKLHEICHQTWDALRIKDFCRIDIRCDAQEHPYVLEVNAPPGLLPPEISTTSYLPLAARAASLSYDALLKIIIATAWKRTLQGVVKK